MVLRKANKDTEKTAQTKKLCMITGCGGWGRTVGKLGDIELNYCGHHRKYGERVLNFFAASIFNAELMDFLRETKRDVFWENRPCLCDECNIKIKDYVNKQITILDEIKQWEPRKKLSKKSKKQMND